MSSEIAIKVENLSKCYQIYAQPHDRLKQSILPPLQRLVGTATKHYYREFWALRDVSFEVRKGETVGIIGRNGSGKSTLLQMICGTLNPSSGSIQTHGRIAALLELGSGFNPEFTGRENIYMNASILGLSQGQIDAKYDDIVAFAEIGEFINQPVKTYSSGMYVRLAFAVIAHVDADILVIDEALAVGDTFFTQKCMRFIKQFQAGGGTLLFVSHDMGTLLNICESAVMLFPGAQRGAIVGPAETLCKDYLAQIYDDPARHQQVQQQRPAAAGQAGRFGAGQRRSVRGAEPELNEYAVSAFHADAEQFGSGGATIVEAGFVDADGGRLANVTGGEAVAFVVRIRADQDIAYPAVGIMVKDRLGQYLYTEGTDKTFRHHQLVFTTGQTIEAVFRFVMPILLRGKYTINVAVAEGVGDEHIQHHWIHDAVIIEALSGPVVHGIGGLLESTMTMEFFAQAEETIK